MALGYLLAVGLSFHVYLRAQLPRWAWRLGILAFVGGLISTVSRAPWLGALLAVAVGLAVGRGGSRRLMTLLAWGAAAAIGILVSPIADKAIAYLPFVGTVDEANVTYRKQLFEVSTRVIAQNPIFGSYSYMNTADMESMRQGQGIIDMVNSYLGVALATGLVGLTLFVGVFAAALIQTWKGIHTAGEDSESAALGRAIFGTLIAVLFMIATMSSILTVPFVYWTLAGLGVAYSRMMRSPTDAVGDQALTAAFRVTRSAP